MDSLVLQNQLLLLTQTLKNERFTMCVKQAIFETNHNRIYESLSCTL